MLTTSNDKAPITKKLRRHLSRFDPMEPINIDVTIFKNLVIRLEYPPDYLLARLCETKAWFRPGCLRSSGDHCDFRVGSNCDSCGLPLSTGIVLLEYRTVHRGPILMPWSRMVERVLSGRCSTKLYGYAIEDVGSPTVSAEYYLVTPALKCAKKKGAISSPRMFDTRSIDEQATND